MPVFSRFLKYFMAVGQHGSIRKAADEMNVSASAITRQILNVEAELNTPLFERLPTGLRLTAAGEIMMAAGNRWQKDLRDLRGQISDLRGLKRGHVEIAIIDALARGHTPALIRNLQTCHPGISIGVRVLDNDSVRHAVSHGEVDFGILFDPHSHRDLTVRAFANVVLGFVVPANHPWFKQPSLRFSACAGQSLILPIAPLAVSQQIDVLIAATGLEVERKVSSDSIQMISSLVQEGGGIGILSSLDVITEVQAGLLSFIPISDPLLRPMTLALCAHAARPPSYAASLILSEMEVGFSDLGYPSSMVV